MGLLLNILSRTPTFSFLGVLDSCFQNPSEIPGKDASIYLHILSQSISDHHLRCWVGASPHKTLVVQ